jgi:hypothetical protein
MVAAFNVTLNIFKHKCVLPVSHLRFIQCTRRVRKVDTKVLNKYSILIYKSDTLNELPVHIFIFQHSRRQCLNIY